MKNHTVQGDTIEWLGVTYKTILASEATNGAMSIVDSVTPPNSGPPRHIHHAEDEAFVVLDGEILVWIEGKEKTVKAGEAAFIPRGKEHTFKVTGHEPSRHLVILTPGGFEGFFEEMAEGQFQIPADMPKIVESGERHHLTFTGPPLD